MNEKPKILIADDSEINRALLKEILGDGYDYLEAEDGAAAVELMRQRTDISLLLLDARVGRKRISISKSVSCPMRPCRNSDWDIRISTAMTSTVICAKRDTMMTS